MTVQLDLPPDIEQQLKRRAAEQGRDVSSVVSDILANTLGMEELPSLHSLPREEFKRRLHAMANRYPGFGGKVDDSRESIYAGRGE